MCRANTEQEAREIHRKVWNQNAVPFLLVISTGWVRLYPGFQYERDVNEDPLAGALRVLHDFHDVTSPFGPIHASEIDNGGIWRELGDSVTPDRRVDWQLLENLSDLDRWLEQNGVTDRRLAHAMIGKFVYLQYLRQREIFSPTQGSPAGESTQTPSSGTTRWAVSSNSYVTSTNGSTAQSSRSPSKKLASSVPNRSKSCVRFPRRASALRTTPALRHL